MVIACRGGDRTAVEERPLLPPQAGELLLKVRVVGLCGTDLFKLDTGSVAPVRKLAEANPAATACGAATFLR